MRSNNREGGQSQDSPPLLTSQQQQRQVTTRAAQTSSNFEAHTSISDYRFIRYFIPEYFMNPLERKSQSYIPGSQNQSRVSDTTKMVDDLQTDVFNNADKTFGLTESTNDNIMSFPSELTTLQTIAPTRDTINSDSIQYCEVFGYVTGEDQVEMHRNDRGCLLLIYNAQQSQVKSHHSTIFDRAYPLMADSNKNLRPQLKDPWPSHFKIKLKKEDFDVQREIRLSRYPRRSCLVIGNVKCSSKCTSSDDEQSGVLGLGARLQPGIPITEKQQMFSNLQFGPERSRNLTHADVVSYPLLGPSRHNSEAVYCKSDSKDKIHANNLVLSINGLRDIGKLTAFFMLPTVINVVMRRLSEWMIYETISNLVSFLSMSSCRKTTLIFHHQTPLNKSLMDLENLHEKHLFNAIDKINTDIDGGDEDEQTYKQITSAHLGSALIDEAYNCTKGLQMESTTLGQSSSGFVSNSRKTSRSKYHRSQKDQGHSWFSHDSSFLALGLGSVSGSAIKMSERQREAGKTKSFSRLLCFLLFVTCFFDSSFAQLESGGWLLSNLLSLPNECTMEGALAPCTFLLTCLIQGGTPVNKCGGGYIYTCCVPTRMSARGAMSVRSDHRPSMPTLRHIGSLFRDAPTYSHAVPQSNLLLPQRLPPPPEIMSPSRLPWRQKGSWFSDERLDRNYDQNSEDALGNSLVPLGHNVVSSEDDLSSFSLGSSTQDLGYALNYKPPDNPNEIYYNEPECGVQKLSTTQISKRIIGGNEAQFAELPWQAHIRIAGYQCGGVLVNRYYVATAAHCVHKARLRDITIHLGEFDTKDTGRHYEPYPKESFGVVEKRTHPNFKYMLTQPDRFDVAVLRLSRPVQYRSNIVPICLPPPGDHFSGMIGIVAGWGKTDNSYGKTGTNILRKVTVPIIENHECLRWHNLKNIDVKLHYEMFCAGHEQGKMDACLGDSGGPLVVNNKGRWTLAGITSAGFGCAVDHQPGIYHKVAITSGWIAANVRP